MFHAVQSRTAKGVASGRPSRCRCRGWSVPFVTESIQSVRMWVELVERDRLI